MRRGDDRAFEVLYARYQRRIGAYVKGMVHDHGRAEDVTQEVFMSALRRIRASDQPIVFKPWIYEIAKNACIDAFRRSHRTEEVSFEAEEELGAAGANHGRLVSHGPTPEAAVDTRMSLHHLRGAFGGLSDVHHQILVMRELEGLSYSEIGKRLKMSRPSVESTLFRARRRLSEEYQELVSGRRCLRVQSIIAGAGEGRIGVRDQRAMGRHVSHCQGCRRAAAIAGFDLAALGAHKALRAKIAALLPLPVCVKRRWLAGAGEGPATAVGEGPGKVAQWSAAISAYGEQASSSVGKTAALIAAVALVGVGAGTATKHGIPGLGGGDGIVQAAPAGGAGDSSQLQRGSSASRHGAAPSGTSAGDGAGNGMPADGAQPGGGAGPGVGADGLPLDLGASAASAGNSLRGGGGARGPGAGGGGAELPGVGDLVGGATDTVDGATGTINQTVDETTDVVDGTVQTVTGTVNGVVDRVTGPGTGTVDQVTTTATGAVNDAASTATGAVDSTADTATGAAGGVTQTVNQVLGRR